MGADGVITARVFVTFAAVFCLPHDGCSDMNGNDLSVNAHDTETDIRIA